MPSWAQNARDMPGALRRSQMPQKMARISCWQLPRDFPTALDLWCQIGVKIWLNVPDFTLKFKVHLSCIYFGLQWPNIMHNPSEPDPGKNLAGAGNMTKQTCSPRLECLYVNTKFPQSQRDQTLHCSSLGPVPIYSLAFVFCAFPAGPLCSATTWLTALHNLANPIDQRCQEASSLCDTLP